jgi:hypothetical protein
MGQTFGSQIFGPWYDIGGLLICSAIFFYFALGAKGMAPLQKERLPAPLKNKKFCFIMSFLMMLMGIGKLLQWW